MTTLPFTSCLRGKNCLFADSAGVALLKEMWTGELWMESFGINNARSFLGKNVNLHLKDGSVIINVHLTRLRKDDYGKNNYIEYVPYKNRKIARILVRSIAWAEMLNMNFVQTNGLECMQSLDKS